MEGLAANEPVEEAPSTSLRRSPSPRSGEDLGVEFYYLRPLPYRFK